MVYTYILEGFLLFILGAAAVYLWLRYCRPKKKLARTTMDMFLDIMKRNQCECTLAEQEKGDDDITYRFVYQGGHFLACFSKDHPFVNIIYFSMMKIVFTDYDYCQEIARRINGNSNLLIQLFYTAHTSKNEVELHLALKTLLPDDPSTEGFLLHQLREFFTIQRSVYAQYEQIKNEDKSRVKDDRISTARTLAFLCEQEINHTELDVPLRTNDDTRYHLSRLLRTFIDEDDLPVTKMTVVSDRGTSIYVDPMQILAFDFASTLIPDSTDEDTDFLCNNVTILIDYDKSEHPFGMDSGIHRIVVNLQAERKGEKSLYFRVAVHMPAPAAVPNGISNRDFMRDWNFLMAYDLVSPAKKLAEYNYVLSEQQSKMKKGENLSDEEFALYVSDDDDSGYNQYWGERAFIVQRYYEAIYFLEHLYVIMQKDFYTFDKDMKNTFYHTCYMLGYSYMELKLYKQAFFYLEPLTFLSRIDYSMEYINCLVNSKNFNALQFITKMLEGVSEDINNPDPDSEPSEPLKALYNFLRRRRAYVYVDLGRYDEAEKEFIQMLDEPLNKDFALGELAYIQRLRKEADTK